jgi:UDP-N-acetylglucosamine 2-epimerase (non-hydrolysing)
MIRTLLVAGTRPNFVKIAPIHRAFDAHGGLEPVLVHTGQHYDASMSDVFFTQLQLPEPDIFLSSGSGTHATQTARVMMELEPVILDVDPDIVVVVGDVNSTFAAALTAKKLHVRVAHVEAGLRSFDQRMPEEINRLATDAISDYLFITEAAAARHLKLEGKPDDRVFFCGNVMIDSLRRFEDKARAVHQCRTYGLDPGSYVLLTAHRPEMVDNQDKLGQFVHGIEEISRKHPVVFPIHPRTLSRIREAGLQELMEGSASIHMVEPLGYLEFLSLIMDAGLVLTDSGGVQEETTALGVPCATIRDNTERPCTIDVGTNELLPLETSAIAQAAERALNGSWKKGALPDLWDGHAAERIADVMADLSPETF